MHARRALALVVPVAVLFAACGGEDGDEGSDETTAAASTGKLEGTLTVLAATSLKGAFVDLAAAFEGDHPGIDVEITTDGSATLATAIIEGGVPADVFASADQPNMQKVVHEGLAEGDTAATFVTNRLEIAVEDGNPLGIATLADLTDPGIRLSLCGEEVPCGSYARKAFEAAGLRVPPAGVEDDVGGVVTKVSLGEADAGIVYVTDVLAADDDLDGVSLAGDEQVVATYPAAVLSEAPNPTAADAFVAFLTSAAAQEILERHGFGPP